MDSNQLLAEIRKMLSDLDDESDRDTAYELMLDVTIKMEELDKHLSNGGSLPQDWLEK